MGHVDAVLPATGSDLPIWLFVTIAVVAVVGGAIALVLGRRRRSRDDG